MKKFFGKLKSQKFYSLSIEAKYNGGNTLFSIKAPKDFKEKRTPTHLCCVVDVSGSMETESVIKTGQNKIESINFSYIRFWFIYLGSCKTFVKYNY
jgi:hypothetical protein